MEKSQEIGKLMAALSKAQGMFKGAKKDSTNPYFKSDYADLSSVWDAIRGGLTANGLAVVQTTDYAEKGVVVETLVGHESGEWILGRLTMKPTKDDPQGVGSAITYARRYGLQAAVGISPVDDDGNAASNTGNGTGEPVQMINEEQAAELRKLLIDTKIAPVNFLTPFKCSQISELTVEQYNTGKAQLLTKKAKMEKK